MVSDNGDERVGVGEELGEEEVANRRLVHGPDGEAEVVLDGKEKCRHNEEVDEEIRPGDNGNKLLEGVEVRGSGEEDANSEGIGRVDVVRDGLG